MYVVKVRNILYFHTKARLSTGKLKDKTVPLCSNLPSYQQIFFELDLSLGPDLGKLLECVLPKIVK